MVAEDKTETWKNRWKSYLDRGVGAEDIVDEAIAEYVQILTTNIANFGPKSAAGDDSQRMIDFCERARGDLVDLVKAGANPAIILRLANPAILNMASHQHHEDKERIKEFEAIANPDYWKKMVTKLERAQEELRKFMDSRIYRDIEKWQMWSDLELMMYPFARVCKEVQTTEKFIGLLIQSLRELRLDRGSRKLTYNGPYVSWEPTEATRGPKPGSGRHLGWDLPTYCLWRYLTVRIGKPHLRHIARLLHFSGWDFPGVIASEEDPNLVTERVEQDEVDKLHKRIKKLQVDLSITLQKGDLITRLEERYETRDLMDYGGFVTSPLEIIEPEQNSNE